MKNTVNRAQNGQRKTFFSLVAKKNKILVAAMLVVASMFSSHVSAQLEVQTSGNVNITKKLAINGATLSNDIGVNVYTPTAANGNSRYGVYSYTRSYAPQSVSTGRNISVFGRVGSSASGTSNIAEFPEQPRTSTAFYAGVVGMANQGVGIYGTNQVITSLPTTWTLGNYAGYFSGDVKVTGVIYGQLSSKLGDSRFLENITQLGGRNVPDIISRLNPVTFTARQDSTQTESEVDNKTHYGFIAQELQEVAPELVIEDGAGYLSINYIELIPVLVQKVQELSAEVATLKSQVNNSNK